MVVWWLVKDSVKIHLWQDGLLAATKVQRLVLLRKRRDNCVKVVGDGVDVVE